MKAKIVRTTAQANRCLRVFKVVPRRMRLWADNCAAHENKPGKHGLVSGEDEVAADAVLTATIRCHEDEQIDVDAGFEY